MARPSLPSNDCLTRPIAFMQQGHERHLLLCDALEAIADGLPDNVNPNLTRCALTLLRSSALDDARAQEQALLQALGHHTASTRHLRFVIDRLAADHADDCCAALEIAGALGELAEHGSVSNPDLLGFMLRAYFDAQRRHIEWEARVFLPLVSELLTSDELANLRQNAAIRPGRRFCVGD